MATQFRPPDLQIALGLPSQWMRWVSSRQSWTRAYPTLANSGEPSGARQAVGLSVGEPGEGTIGSWRTGAEPAMLNICECLVNGTQQWF